MICINVISLITIITIYLIIGFITISVLKYKGKFGKVKFTLTLKEQILITWIWPYSLFYMIKHKLKTKL